MAGSLVRGRRLNPIRLLVLAVPNSDWMTAFCGSMHRVRPRWESTPSCCRGRLPRTHTDIGRGLSFKRSENESSRCRNDATQTGRIRPGLVLEERYFTRTVTEFEYAERAVLLKA